tara:strand:- start:185 stop:445 length:261 start_codon:yes stop_codon:yes gene_type:complete
MTFTNKNHYTSTLGSIPEMEECTTFEKVENKDLLGIKSKLEVLELIGGIVDSLREGLTRQLVINDIKDDDELNEKIGNLLIKDEKE